MDITPFTPTERLRITGYGPGRFTVNTQSFSGSLVLFPEALYAWPASCIEEMDLAFLGGLCSQHPSTELLLLGTGNAAPSSLSALRSTISSLGIPVEIMNSGAACRTYNVLLAEGRKIGAALIAV